MKKIIVGGITLLTIGLLYGCENTPSKKQEHISTLAYEATSSLALLSAKTNPVQLSTKNTTKVDELLPQIELLLQNGSGFETKSVESDMEEYSFKEIISFNVSLTEVDSYSLYYNTYEEKIEEDDEDEIETKITYQGIAKTTDAVYNFDAILETEQDGNESENEMEFKLKTAENSYIKVKQEIELEGNEKEEEYQYKIVEDGKTTYEYKLSIELEDKETEIKLVLNNIVYKVKYDEFGNISIKEQTK